MLGYALEKWESFAQLEGYPIPERLWHVTGYYKQIRDKAKDVPGCYKESMWKIGNKRRLSDVTEDRVFTDRGGRRAVEGDFWPSRLCELPLQGRSLWGPRHNPMETSLLTIMRPNPMGDIDPNIREATYMDGTCYQPPDRAAPWTVAPAGEPFAPLIGASRRLTLDAPDRRRLRNQDGKSSNGETTEMRHDASAFGSSYMNATRALAGEVPPTNEHAIVPGYGIYVKWGRPGVCDGTAHAVSDTSDGVLRSRYDTHIITKQWCDKRCEGTCFMSGAQDNRGMVCFNSLSGWLVFDVKNIKHGFIGARMEPVSAFLNISIAWTFLPKLTS